MSFKAEARGILADKHIRFFKDDPLRRIFFCSEEMKSASKERLQGYERN